MPYGKIFDSIFGSSIMESNVETRYIWMCMIIVADKEGFIDETIPALSRRFNVPIENMERAIKCFMEPDASSRTPDKDGRRIEPIRESFGWKIINYDYYRQLRDDDQRREYMREYMRNYRQSQDNAEPLTPVNNGKQQLAHTDTDTDTDTGDNTKVLSSPSSPRCPHKEIVNAYHKILPELASVKEWNDKRKAWLRKRWNDSIKRQNLKWWEGYFEYVRKSPFLMGNKTDFQADLEWLIRPTNFTKVIEGRYHK